MDKERDKARDKERDEAGDVGFEVNGYRFQKYPFLASASRMEAASLCPGVVWHGDRLMCGAPVSAGSLLLSALAWIGVEAERGVALDTGTACFALLGGLLKMRTQGDADLGAVLALLDRLEPRLDCALSVAHAERWVAKLHLHVWTRRDTRQVLLLGAASLLPHSCLPTAVLRFDGSGARIEALRALVPLDQITLSFVRFPIDGPARRDMVAARAVCPCVACASQPPARLSADAVAFGYRLGAKPLRFSTHCWWCGAEARQRCARCHVAAYCDARCQRANWPAHRQICAELAAQASGD